MRCVRNDVRETRRLPIRQSSTRYHCRCCLLLEAPSEDVKPRDKDRTRLCCCRCCDWTSDRRVSGRGTKCWCGVFLNAKTVSTNGKMDRRHCTRLCLSSNCFCDKCMWSEMGIRCRRRFLLSAKVVRLSSHHSINAAGHGYVCNKLARQEESVGHSTRAP